MIRKLREMNRHFPKVGLLKPTQYLQNLKLKPYVDVALDSLGIREYSKINYPANGYNFDLTVRSSDHWRKIERRTFEPYCIDYVSRATRKGSSILDVGAGFGTYTFIFSKFAGSDGAVYAFEPDPVCNRVLYDNLRKNHMKNVKVDSRCASYKPGKAILKSKMWGMGQSTIMDHLGSEAMVETVVGATTLDDFCIENNVRPAGMKIDVEGAEGLVLQGAKKVIEKNRPWVLLEFHGGYMSGREMKNNWRLATESAKKIIFLDGNSKLFSPGDEIHEMPDCTGFHMFIQY